MTSTIKVDTISENTSANGVSIDGVTIKDGGIAATLASTITVADNSDTLSLVSTDAGGNQGPILNFKRDSSSPADDDILGQLTFTGENSASEAIEFVRIRAGMADVTDGTEDSRYTITTFTGGSQFGRLNIEALETVFNENSTDVDFRVESNGNANMLFVDGGNDLVGIGTASPATKLTIDEGGEPPAEGMLLLQANSSSRQLRIQPPTNADNGFLDYRGGNFVFLDDGTEVFRFQGTSEVVVNDASNDIDFRVESANLTHMFFIDGGAEFIATGETAADVSRLGLCLNQAGNDGNILTLKSSDVAHGVTNVMETDTYLKVSKNSAGSGGVNFTAGMETVNSFLFRGYHSSENTTQSTSGSDAVFRFDSSLRSGTSGTGNGATANIFRIDDDNTARVLITGDGDIFSDTGAGPTAYDTYEDAQLVRAYDLAVSSNIINSKFDKFISYNKEKLADLRIIGKNADGSPSTMLNINGMQRLHNGAIWQQYEKHQRLASAFYKLAEKTIGKEEADKLLTDEEIQLLN